MFRKRPSIRQDLAWPKSQAQPLCSLKIIGPISDLMGLIRDFLHHRSGPEHVIRVRGGQFRHRRHAIDEMRDVVKVPISEPTLVIVIRPVHANGHRAVLVRHIAGPAKRTKRLFFVSQVPCLFGKKSRNSSKTGGVTTHREETKQLLVNRNRRKKRLPTQRILHPIDQALDSLPPFWELLPRSGGYSGQFPAVKAGRGFR